MSWTIKTVNECWKCKHLQKSVYIKLKNETLYNEQIALYQELKKEEYSSTC